MSTLYPKYIDKFTVKKNETGDKTGDLVLAEHVNDLQDSIVAIESTLGASPQGVYSTIAQRLTEGGGAQELALPRVTMFKGDLAEVNGSVSTLKAAKHFAYFNHVIITDFDIYNSDVTNVRNVILATNEASNGTMFYGQVDSSLFTKGYTEDQIAIFCDKWKEVGAKGIYFSNFGYDAGNTRQRQNELIDTVHNLGMAVIINTASIPEIINDMPGASNPEGDSIRLNNGDAYLHFGLSLSGAGYDTQSDITGDANALLSVKNALGVKIYIQDYIDYSADQVSRNKRFYFGQAVSMLYSFDGYYARRSSLLSGTMDYYISLPIVGKYYEESPIVTLSGTTVSRQSPIGKINIDLLNKRYTFENIKIPLGFIDMNEGKVPTSSLEGTISNEQLDIDVIAIINGSDETVKIDPVKIDFSNASNKIIESINLVANNEYPKIDANALTNLSIYHIEGILLQAFRNILDEEMLSGDYSANLMGITANQVSAINAYIGKLKAGTIQGEFIEGEAIKAGSITGDILATNTITADKLSIHANGGLNKWVGTIVQKDTVLDIIDPDLSSVLGKDVLKKIEVSETIDPVVISSDGYVSSLTPYLALWETNVFCTSPYVKTYTLTTNTRAALYVNGAKIVTSDLDGVISYGLSLRTGWNKIQVIQDHTDELSTSFSMGVSLLSQSIEYQKENPTGIVRIDAYADRTTQITGDYIKTGTINVNHLQTGTLSAANIKTGTLDAETIISVGDSVTISGSTGIDLYNGTGLTVSGARSIKVDQGSIVVTEGLDDRIIIGQYITGEYGIEILTANELGNPGESVIMNKDGFKAGPNLIMHSDGSVEMLGTITATEGRFTGKIGVGVSRTTSVDDALIIIDGSDTLNPEIIVKVESTTTTYSSFDENGLPIDKIETTPGGYVRINKQGISVSDDYTIWETKLHAGGLTVGNTDIGDGVITTDKLNATEVNVGLVNAGMVNAIQAYIENITAANGTFEQLLTDFLVAKQIDATRLSFYSDASDDPLNKGFLEITNGGMLVSSKSREVGGGIPVTANLVRVDKAGIFISNDGGVTWAEKLTGAGLSVTAAEITDVYASSIISGTLQASTSINVASVVDINGTAGIVIDGGTGAGLTVKEGTILIKESLSDRMIIGKQPTGEYGVTLLTAGSPITLDKRGLIADKFSIGTDGTIIAIDGTFSGTISSYNATFGSQANHVAVDEYGIVIGTGDIVDTRDLNNQALKINAQGIIAKSGNIGGLDIVPTIDLVENELAIIDSRIVAMEEGLENFSLSSKKIQVTGQEAVSIDDGTLVVKKNNDTYLSLGSLGGTPVEYGLKIDLYDGLNQKTGAYIQLDQFGLRSFDGLINPLDISSDGTIRIVGEIEATSGKLSNLSVDGNIVVSQGGTITAGDATISSTGIAGTGYSLTSAGVVATGGKIGNWTIGSTSLYSGSLVLDSAAQTISVPGAIIGQYEATKYGILATAGKIGGWSVQPGSLTSTNISIDSINQKITTTGVIIGSYDTGLYGISATSGRIGGWTLSATGLNSAAINIDSDAETISISNQLVIGNYDGINYGLKAGNVILNAAGVSSTNFSLDETGIDATGGKIAGWNITGNQLYSQGIHLDSTDSSIWLGYDKATSKLKFLSTGEAKMGIMEFNKVVDLVEYSMYSPKFSIDSIGNVNIEGHVTATSGSFTGAVQATSGYFGDAGKRVEITADGLTAGGTKISSTGITVGESLSINSSGLMVNSNTSSIRLGSYFYADKDGIVTTAGSVGGWSIGADRIYSMDGEIAAVELDALNRVINISNQVKLGKLSDGVYGLQAGATTLNNSGIHAGQGDIAGWVISETEISKITLNVKTALSDGSLKIVDSTDPLNPKEMIALNNDGSAKLGALSINAAGDVTAPGFTVTQSGAVFSGELDAASGTFAGSLSAESGTIGGWNITAGSIEKNNVVMSSLNGISLGLNNTVKINGVDGIKVTSEGVDNFTLDLDGNLTATSANIKGNINATSGKIGEWLIHSNVLKDAAEFPKMVIAPQNIKLFSGATSSIEEVVIGQYDPMDITKYGIKAGNTILNSGGISAKQGDIGGIQIGENYLQSQGFSSGVSGFKFYTEDVAGTKKGKIIAADVDLTGTINATVGTFGTGSGRITANETGIFHGAAVGDTSSNFYITSTGNAYFRGAMQVSQTSLIKGGDIVIEEGNIIAGNINAGHVKMTLQHNELGGEISAVDGNGDTTFRVNNLGAYFKGDITATTGSILGNLSVGEGSSIYIDGRNDINQGLIPGIYLYDFTSENTSQIVRLSNKGLYVSVDGGITYEPALTGGGINANAITDGVLTITDSGKGASGISIRQYNYLTDEFEENVTITPAGINVLNGAITVYSDVSGEVLIGGGYLRVKGLDMGVVTSNNFIGNGNFSMVSDDYGVKQNNAGEVFLGRAQSSGGAVSNPTYHYAGWPDFGERNPHTVYTYDVNMNGTINDYNPDNPDDPYHPVVSRVSFNPQWVAVHPITGHGIVPADADNFISIVDPDTGLIVRHMKSWKGGLFGADFSADGTTMIACGDDIDRKRSPWDMVVFDTSSTNPHDWFLKGIIEVGEFPSKVVCDTNGHYAYVTVSLDNTIYKLDMVKMRVDKILNMTDPRGMPPVPMAIAISNDEQFIYVGGVVTDAVYEVPVDFNTKIEDCRMFSMAPYPGNRGIPHDVHVIPTADGSNGLVVVSSSSTTDGNVLLFDPTRAPETYFGVTIGMKSDGITPRKMIVNAIQSWIDGTMDGIDATDGSTVNKLAYLPDSTAEEKAAWNFFSTTTITPHPDPNFKLIYATVTNRCMVSVLDYTTGELLELQRIPAGSNASGVKISMAKDGLGNITRHKLFVANHHFHTYPLGANKIWGYRSTDNYYSTPDVFDTGQTYYHFNPSGLLITDENYDGNGNHKLWVANRSTNEVTVISTDQWENRDMWVHIKDVGNKPYEIKAFSDMSKILVSNDDSDNKHEPDFVTIIDKATMSIDGRIYVGDNPLGIEIRENKWLYVACNGMSAVQKVNIATRKVVDTEELSGSPRHLKLVDNKLYVTCSDSNLVYCLDADTLDKMKVFNEPDQQGLQSIAELMHPSQMEHVNGKLYITNKSSDHVVIIDTTTNTVSDKTIKVGSSPNPIKYNQALGVLYVGNSGEGSVCIIDPVTDKVIEWSMTGDNPEYITCTSNGDRWYASAHGPEDIVVYPEASFTGDAYLDNNGKTHKYGSAYWMPSRSEWVRGADRTLTSFSSVEFWPDAELSGKKGYAYMTIMGMFDAFAQMEQDVYPLTNASDGSSDVTTEIMELGVSDKREFTEMVANFDGIPDRSYSKIVVSDRFDPSISYIEGAHYEVDYINNTITRKGEVIPASGIRQAITLNDSALLIDNGHKYNLIQVFPGSQTEGAFVEGVDYTIDRVANTITRLVSGTIVYGAALTVLYRYQINVRYYYHPHKRNYEDVVMSADLFWKWPRPENQWVKIQVDELVPKFIMVDNDNTETFIPTYDFGRGDKEGKYYEPTLPLYQESLMKERLSIPEHRGLTYSALSNRALSASVVSSAIPVSGNAEEVDSIKDGSGLAVLPPGIQYLEMDIGTVYYVNKLAVDYGPGSSLINNSLVEVSTDGDTWIQIYTNANAPRTFEVMFEDTIEGETYNISKKMRYIRVYGEGTSTDPLANNQFKQIKVMGDWKSSKAYVFSSGTVWDSEGRRETYLGLNALDPVRFDDPTLTTTPDAPNTRPNQRVRYRTYYTSPMDTHERLGEVQGYNKVTGDEYKGICARDMETKKTYEEMGLPLPTLGEQFDFAYDYITNTIWRLEGSAIESGEEIRVIYRFLQEDLSNLPLCISYKDPATGEEVNEHPASVAETDVTAAWVEWSFKNDYRCDWYMGWIADIGLGDIDIYVDGELIHSISQMSTKVERFSQITQDLLPGEHKIRLVQRQGRVNFDIIKLEDYQLLNRNSEVVASPATNPVELFSWFPVKISPDVARTYLGRGTQVLSGAYDNPRVDKETRLPNNQVPIKYRVRFVSTLEGRGAPIPDYGGYGGEAVGNEFTFERGSVMITSVTMEHGVNPTYWRMAPAADKYTGFMIEQWDSSDPSHTGIQTVHLANGSVTGEKIKSYSIIDDHINSSANIQESKLALNHATHPHLNKAIIDEISGWGSSGVSTLLARADHTHEELANSTFTGSVSIGEDLSVTGSIKELGKYKAVHRRPLYGLAGDLQFQTDSSIWEDITTHRDLFGYGVPAPGVGATRHYRLYAVYGDNITDSDTVRARMKIEKVSDGSSMVEWIMDNTWGAANGRRDGFSPYFQATGDGSEHTLCLRIQNDSATYSGADKEVGIEWLELIAYDLYE